MKLPESKLQIKTLGSFSMLVDGKPVVTNWPNETLKVLFCSLLSPLDLYVTWDRVCRSMLSVQEIPTSRRRREEISIQPLNCFLVKELGFNPLITENEGIRIDSHNIQVDAFEFHSSVVDGLRLLSLGDHAAAHKKLSRAKSLYGGCYLPGLPGKIITNTRNDLESLYQDLGHHAAHTGLRLSGA